MRGVHKRFGGVVALDGVDLEVGVGEVHALVGENGAGKSTLMKVLAGALDADSGSVEFDGRPLPTAGPAAARDAGVAMIYQELNLAPHLSIEANILLGREVRRRGLLAPAVRRAAIVEALGFLGRSDLDPRRTVSTLGPADRQLVEIARALVGDAKLIVMDEPTSSLTQSDAAHLLDTVGRLVAQRGVSVIYISHFLEEVERVAQRYTVLRDGRTVATGRIDETDHAQLIRSMVGREIAEIYPALPHADGPRVLAVRGLAGAPLPRAVSLELRRGEVLGIFGLVGAGRTEFLRALVGLSRRARGEVSLGDGGPGVPPSMGLLSEDRKGEGLALELDIATNIALPRLREATRRGLLRRSLLASGAMRWCERIGIKAASPWQPVGRLSGGNQQKVALARLLEQNVDVLLLDEPTRGVDVGSKAEIYRLLGEWLAQGKAVLMVGSYVPELLGVCHRIAVMHKGTLGPARPTSEWTEDELLAAASLGEATEGVPA